MCIAWKDRHHEVTYYVLSGALNLYSLAHSLTLLLMHVLYCTVPIACLCNGWWWYCRFFICHDICTAILTKERLPWPVAGVVCGDGRRAWGVGWVRCGVAGWSARCMPVMQRRLTDIVRVWVLQYWRRRVLLTSDEDGKSRRADD